MEREKMNTYRISEEEIKDMPVLATGYKVFYNEWTSNMGTTIIKTRTGTS